MKYKIELMTLKRYNGIISFWKNTEALKFWQHIGFEEDIYDYRTYKKDYKKEETD